MNFFEVTEIALYCVHKTVSVIFANTGGFWTCILVYVNQQFHIQDYQFSSTDLSAFQYLCIIFRNFCVWFHSLKFLPQVARQGSYGCSCYEINQIFIMLMRNWSTIKWNIHVTFYLKRSSVERLKIAFIIYSSVRLYLIGCYPGYNP